MGIEASGQDIKSETVISKLLNSQTANSSGEAFLSRNKPGKNPKLQRRNSIKSAKYARKNTAVNATKKRNQQPQ